MKPMRRSVQALSKEDAELVLARNDYGVLSLKPDGPYPYGVPLNYSYVNGKIYLHGANTGYKLEAMRHDPHVCFTVIDTALEDYDAYSEFFRSVIVFGTVHIPEEREEKIRSIITFAEKLSPGNPRLREWIERDLNRMVIIEITVDEITGKHSIEYVRDNGSLSKDKPQNPKRNTVK